MMEPTQIKRGPQERGIVPRSDSETLPEAYQRAPTLMAGEEAGGGGAVQVWAPDSALVKKQAYRAGAAAAAYLIGSAVPVWLLLAFTSGALSPFLFVLYFALFVIPWVSIGMYGMSTGAAIPALRRKRYLTTDDAGIGITTWKDTRYLAWDEIATIELAFPWGLRLQSVSGEKIDMNLSGYPAQVRKELLDRMVQCSGLEPYKSWYCLPGERFYVRPGYAISPATGKLLRPPAAGAALPPGDETPIESSLPTR